MISNKMKEINNDGFNYKDRKVTRQGRIWVKKGEQEFNYEDQSRKNVVKQYLREGILSKNIDLLS